MGGVEVWGPSQLTEAGVLDFSPSPSQQHCVSWECKSHSCRTGKEDTCLFLARSLINRLRKLGISQSAGSMSYVTSGRGLASWSSISSYTQRRWVEWCLSNLLTTVFYDSVFCDPCLPWEALQSFFSLLLPLFILIIAFYYYSSVCLTDWSTRTISPYDKDSIQAWFKQSWLKQKFCKSWSDSH